jgi:hypothetical protein
MNPLPPIFAIRRAGNHVVLVAPPHRPHSREWDIRVVQPVMRARRGRHPQIPSRALKAVKAVVLYSV